MDWNKWNPFLATPDREEEPQIARLSIFTHCNLRANPGTHRYRPPIATIVGTSQAIRCQPSLRMRGPLSLRSVFAHVVSRQGHRLSPDQQGNHQNATPAYKQTQEL